MPLYFFDTDDGDRQVSDDTGVVLASVDDVERETVALLRDLAHIQMPVGHRTMTATVRDDRDSVVYRARMTLDGERVEPRPSTEAGASRGGAGQTPPSP